MMVKNTLRVYEKNGKDVYDETVLLDVESHWNSSNFVVLKALDETYPSYTVSAEDLVRAIKNATNVKR